MILGNFKADNDEEELYFTLDLNKLDIKDS
jgi:hypothetical protein